MHDKPRPRSRPSRKEGIPASPAAPSPAWTRGWESLSSLAGVRYAPAAAMVDRVVVPVEGTDREFYAQQWAIELAAGLNVPLWGVHVAPVGTKTPRDIFSYLDAGCARWGVEFQHAVLEGNDVVEEVANELGVRDVLVVGTRRLGGSYHVGSVTAEFVRRAPCPVQVVRIG